MTISKRTRFYPAVYIRVVVFIYFFLSFILFYYDTRVYNSSCISFMHKHQLWPKAPLFAADY